MDDIEQHSNKKVVIVCLFTFIVIILLFINYTVAQNIVKYQITDDGTELSIGTAVKIDDAGNIAACGDNDSEVIGLITAKEVDGVNRYYLVSSANIALAPLPNTVLSGDKLTTAAGGGLRTASCGEIIVGIALQNGDGNSATMENVMLTLGYASSNDYIANQISSAQSANFWIDDIGRVGHLIVDSSAVINESGGNYDFQVKGNGDANLLFTDANDDMVGIGTNSPTQKLELNGAFRFVPRIGVASASDTSGVIWVKQVGGAPDTLMFWDDEHHLWLAVSPTRANPKCQVYGGSDTDCNPGPTVIPFTNETRVDNGFTHDNTTNPSRIYVSDTGYYKISYQIPFNNNVNNRVVMHTYIRRNGTTSLGGDGYCYLRNNTTANREACSGVVNMIYLIAGDYIEVVADRYSGADGTTYAIDPECYLMIERENVGEGASGGSGGGGQWSDAGTHLYPTNASKNICPNVSGTVGEATGRWDNIYSVDGNFSNNLTILGGINDGDGFGTAGYVLRTDGSGDIYWSQDSTGGKFERIRTNGNLWLTDSVTLVSGTNISLTQTGDSITIASSTNWDTLKAYRDTTDHDFQSIRSESSPWLYDSLTIVAGSNISLTQTGDSLVISSSGTPGGNFQKLRSDANPWLYDSVTFISGTNISMSQSGNQITITSTGASQWSDGGTYLQPINANRDIIPNTSGSVGQSANRWSNVFSTNGDFSGNLVVSGNVIISGGLNDGTGFGTAGYCLKTDGSGDIYWASDSVGGSFEQLRSDGNPWLTDSLTLVSGQNITLTQTGDSIMITSSTPWDTLGAYRDTTEHNFISLDNAYDYSGSGAGRIITVDSGPIQLNASGTQSRIRMVQRSVPTNPGDGDIEIFDTNLGPLPFYYDDARGKWLSFAVFTDGGGTNRNQGVGYLRMFNGLVTSATVGHQLPDDACIVAVALSCNISSTCTGLLRANGTDLSGTAVSLSAQTKNKITDLNVDVNDGDIIAPYCSSGTMRSPQMQYWYRIRR